MEIYQQAKIDPSKPNVFLDIDDVILNSSDTVIDILNKKYNLKKSKKDLKDWTFKSITHNCTPQMVEDIFCSEEFWNTITFRQELINLFEENEKLLNSFNWILTTKGNEVNHKQKYNYLFNSGKVKFFAENKNRFSYYALSLEEKKSAVNMLGGIQIDDNYNNLRSTDASVKILLKNEIATNYNDYYLTSDNLQNLYIVNTLDEIGQILEFIRVNENNEFE